MSHSPKKKKRWLILTSVFFVFAGLVIYVLSQLPKPIDLETLAPDFSLSSNKQATIRLSETRGKHVLLVFWASWCDACAAEFPALEKLWRTYKAQNLMIFAINRGESPDKIDSFLLEHPASFPVLIDENETINKLYGVWSLPTIYLIDTDGRVAHHLTGLVQIEGIAHEYVLVEYFKDLLAR